VGKTAVSILTGFFNMDSTNYIPEGYGTECYIRLILPLPERGTSCKTLCIRKGSYEIF